jgi:E3 ubiquitin-protein ligase BAH
MSAAISPETRRHLEGLMQTQSHLESDEIVKVPQSGHPAEGSPTEDKTPSLSELDGDEDVFQTDEEIAQAETNDEQADEALEVDQDDGGPGRDPRSSIPRTIEIVLHSDSEFFNLLTQELSSIDTWKANQKRILTDEINALGQEVSRVVKPPKFGSRSDMDTWREIFSLYRDASVFFSSAERYQGPRNATQARERIQWFANQLQSQNLVCPLFNSLTDSLATSEISAAMAS